MAITKIQSESLNLADTYAFTGTVTGAGETNKPYFRAYMNGTQNVGTAGTTTKIEIDTEVLDSAGAYDPTTNYRFTPQKAGKYMIFGLMTAYSSNSTFRYGDIYIYKNGSEASRGSGLDYSANYGYRISPFINDIITFNGSTDYVELYMRGYAGGTTVNVEGSNSNTWFGGYYLSET